MCKPLSLIIGSHNHVSYGSSDEEFRDIYKRRLKPFILALNKYPAVQGTLHYSGALLHWIERFHPEIFMLLKELISRKQVELLGGGFYEPMMPLISQTDRIGQIEMLTTYIRQHFGKRPQGCWLPALAWDQNMVSVLERCDMAYTFLAEEDFIRAGLSGEDLYAPCLTEDQGKLAVVFPLSSKFREIQGPVFTALEKIASETPSGKERLLLLASNPANEKDMNDLFEDLCRCEAFVDFTTPGKVYKSKKDYKKAYFYASSEKEPGTKTVPSHPKDFLVNYPEANGIYAKMIFTGVLINQVKGDKTRKRVAQEEYWKAQGYDALFRTESGGIYRNTLRNAVYHSLLLAEKTTRKKGVFIPSLVTFDIDLDGEEEYLFQDDHINCYVKSRGAAVFEFDFLPQAWNYLDTFSANNPQGKEQGPLLKRMAFTDILADTAVPCAALADTGFAAGKDDPRIRYCGREQYLVKETDKTREKAGFVLGPAQGSRAVDSIEIVKQYHLKKDALHVRYSLTNLGKERGEFNFVPRIDLSFPGEGHLYQRIAKITARGREDFGEGEALQVLGLEFGDIKNELLITVSSDKAFDCRLVSIGAPCPVLGLEKRFYQSTCVLPLSSLSLEPGASWSADYTLKITS
jgi:hypothetical protein